MELENAWPVNKDTSSTIITFVSLLVKIVNNTANLTEVVPRVIQDINWPVVNVYQ